MNRKVRARAASLRRDLATDQDCEKWLMSGIAGGVSTVFSSTMLGVSNFANTPYSQINATTADPGSAYYITVNASGVYFNSNAGAGFADKYDAQVKGLTGGSRQAQYFLLLHEFAHYFQAPGFVANDGENIRHWEAQKLNNDLLWDKCSKTIQGFSGAL
ncbi:MAG: hypothetical protein NTY38_16730 [Acidobacteria bacterium]|nr:hypothetical protein [Acidobacteriota bacterium]